MGNNPNVIDVNENNFEELVIEQSYKKPVVVDFWAPWCGPCQILKPVLEKLANEYGFILAKVNTDENQSIAFQYGVSGIPDVRIFVNGKEVDKFVGALPEPKIREIIEKYITTEVDTLLEQAKMEVLAGNLEKAESIFNYLLKEYPTNKKVILEYAKFLIKKGDLDKAKELLDSIKEYEKEYYSKAQALKELINFKKYCSELSEDNELDKLLKEGSCAVLNEDYKTALEKFLKIVQIDKNYKDEVGRKSMVAIFNMLGESNPLTKEYRRKLAMWLY
jgi:putative thioredoxin